MGTGAAFLLLETTATTFMAGVLWTMQLLNYPLLALVGSDALPRYEAEHNRRFALVVIRGCWPQPQQISAWWRPGPARSLYGRQPASSGCS